MIQLLAGETKDGDPRIVPMNDRVREVLVAWEEKTKENYPRPAGSSIRTANSWATGKLPGTLHSAVRLFEFRWWIPRATRR